MIGAQGAEVSSEVLDALRAIREDPTAVSRMDRVFVNELRIAKLVTTFSDGTNPMTGRLKERANELLA